MAELPLLEPALAEAAQRRYGRQRRRPAPARAARSVAVLAAVAAVALLAVRLTGGGESDERAATPPAPRWTTTVDVQRGFTLSLPSGWERSAERLTPYLEAPRERFAAGTFPLQHRKGACSHMPTGALSTMRPADGFVTVQERSGVGRPTRSGYPRRPARFAARAKARPGDLTTGCLPARRDDLVEFWLPFSDAGRAFYALVVLGRDASRRTRAEAFAILDRIRFDPVVRPSG